MGLIAYFKLDIDRISYFRIFNFCMHRSTLDEGHIWGLKVDDTNEFDAYFIDKLRSFNFYVDLKVEKLLVGWLVN